jgi:hypothetical protein
LLCCFLNLDRISNMQRTWRFCPGRRRSKPPFAEYGSDRIRKQDALGVHGTVFYELERYKAHYRAKREDAVDPSAINQAQRRLFGIG